MDCCRSALVVLDAAEEALTQSLIEHKDDLSGNLCTQEDCFLHSMTPAARSTIGSVAPARSCGTGCVAVALVLPFGEVLGWLERLDRRWGL